MNATLFFRFLGRGMVLFFLVWPAYGQEKERVLLDRDVLDQASIRLPLEEEYQEVISASRSSQKIEDLPLSVHIITREEILLNGYQTLVDVLKHVPGIKVSQPGSAELGETFLMRGLIGNEYAKVLVNNLPIQPSTYGAIAVGAQLPIRQAERIEILLGPAAAIYGADAMTGVINIITHVPEQTHYSQADLQLGTQGMTYLNFSAGGKTGKDNRILQYHIYGSRQGVKNLPIHHEDPKVFNTFEYLNAFYTNSPVSVADYPSEEALIQERYQPYYSGTLTEPEKSLIPQRSHQLGVELNFQNWQFSYNHMYVNSHASIGLNPYLFSYADPNTFLGNYVNRLSLAHNAQQGKWYFTSQVSYLRQRQDIRSSQKVHYFSGDQGYVFNYSASDDLFAEQIFRYYANDQLELTGGLSFQLSGNLPITNDLARRFDPDLYKSFSTDPLPADPLFGEFGFNPIRFSNAAAFAQVYWSLPNARLIGGFRYDRNSLYGSSTHPRLAALFKLSDQSSLRFSYGTAFRAPPSNVSYRSVAFPADAGSDSLFYAVIPNQALGPERYSSYEMGLRQRINPQIFLDLGVFFAQLQNSISARLVEVDRAAFPRVVSNNGPARSVGNSQSAQLSLIGIQTALKARRIWPNLFNIDSDLYVQISRGQESLPDNSALERSLGNIDDARMTPRLIGQWSIRMSPLEKWRFRLHHTLMGDWVRRFIPSVEAYNDPSSINQGYYTLDLQLSYFLHPSVHLFSQVNNVLNEEYGGIGASGLDLDLFYNPQQKRTFVIGVSLEMQ